MTPLTEAITKAYAPHPVTQPDGSTKHLCYLGRITRAQAMLAGETDAQKRKAIQTALDKIDSEYKAAADLADVAMKAAREMGEKVILPRCECEGCRAANRDEALRDVRWLIRAQMKQAIPLVERVVPNAAEKVERDHMWAWMKSLYETVQEYRRICEEYDETPNLEFVQ